MKIAERCNLACSYCYMYQHADRSYLRRPRLISEDVFLAMARRVREYSDRHGGVDINVVLHGGEPMLMAPSTLDRYLDRSAPLFGGTVSFGLQTNGTLVTDAWIETLRKHRITPSVSLDGPAALHDAVRPTVAGRGSYAAAVAGLAALADAGLNPGVLAVVNPSAGGRETYRFLRTLPVTRASFLIPDATYDSRPSMFVEHGATPIADFLIPAFDAWMEDDDPAFDIKLFSDAIKVLAGGDPRSDLLGGSGAGQDYLVVDTDGSIQASDVLKICFEGAAETGLNVLTAALDDPSPMAPAVWRLIHEGVPLANRCLACQEGATCRGGSVPHRYSRAGGFDNPSVWCDDMLALLTHIRRRVTPYLRLESELPAGPLGPDAAQEGAHV